jgi:hypothetical protein
VKLCTVCGVVTGRSLEGIAMAERLVEPPAGESHDRQTAAAAETAIKHSAKDLAEETGLAESRIRMILMNPLYNGWVRRHRRSDRETLKPAPWRANPPVSDELWARVESVRRSKTRGGGPHHRGRRDLLAGLLECSCGRRIRSDGRMGSTERVAKLHFNPCPAWGRSARIAAATWEVPILAQLGSLRLDNAVRSQVAAVLSAGARPVTMDRVRLERQMRELALEHAGSRIDDAGYLARMGRLREQLTPSRRSRRTSCPRSGPSSGSTPSRRRGSKRT